MTEFAGKNVLVAGCGRSGLSAARLLLEAGARPTLFDSAQDLDVGEIRRRLFGGAQGPGDSRQAPVEFLLGDGSLSLQNPGGYDLAVFSPGVPLDSPVGKWAQEAGIPVWGEVELAWRFEKGRVIAVTGTNGKTTTVSLTGEILRRCYSSVFVAGNIGNPYTGEVRKTAPDSVTVVEISSFQLETARTFAPFVSAILNLTPDHMDRHRTMENYVRIKQSIAGNQGKGDFCVLNAADPYTASFAAHCPATPVMFSSRGRLRDGYYLEGGNIYKSVGGVPAFLLSTSQIQLLGVHNYENVMAAIALCDCFGAPMEKILEAVKSFPAVEHRIEYVATRRGVRYYNDSKATNPDAAIQGIRAMQWPTVLIAGGYDKKSRYDEWIQAFDGKVKFLVLIGQTREAIAECARAHGFPPDRIVFADTFPEALDACVERAVPGDAVLLSPACASWGMFPNYEVRGKLFKDYVSRIPEAAK